MRRAGLSLVEVLVASAILTVVGLAFVGALSQSAKETRTTSEFSLSLFLTQKVVEELIQTSLENPHSAESLRSLAGNRISVADPLNPYFSAIEDIAPPYGVMLPGQDLGVDVRAPTLHRLYRDFNLSLAVADRALPAPTGAPPLLDDVRIEYDWPGLAGASRESRFPFLMTKAHIAPVPKPRIAQDLAGMDAAIRSVLFMHAPGPDDLVAFVAQASADLAAVRDLGAILVISSYAITEMSMVDSAITTLAARLPIAAPGPPDDPALRAELARLYERRAAATWQALLYCRDPAARLSTSFVAAQVGGRTLTPAPFVALTLSKSVRMRQSFEYDLAMALVQYVSARKLLPPLGARPFWQYTLERKVLELAKLAAMSQESGDVTFVNRWLDSLMAQYSGRNRAITDYLAREKRACGNLVGIQSLHPQIRDRISAMNVAATALGQLQARVIAELF